VWLARRSTPPERGPTAVDCAYGFDGTLDELAIFDKALSPAQILAHFVAAKR